MIRFSPLRGVRGVRGYIISEGSYGIISERLPFAPRCGGRGVLGLGRRLRERACAALVTWAGAWHSVRPKISVWDTLVPVASTQSCMHHPIT